MRGAWIEIHRDMHAGIAVSSLPMRGAWIEIYLQVIIFIYF